MADEKDTETPDTGATESDAALNQPTPVNADDDVVESNGVRDDGISDDAVDDADDTADGRLDADEPDDGDADEGRDDLVGVGAATAGREAGRSRGGSAVAPAKPAERLKKNRATPRQRTERDEPKRGGPVEFVKGSIGELKKVVYPTGSQLGNYFVVVLIFVLMVIAIVTALDAGFGWVMLRIFT